MAATVGVILAAVYLLWAYQRVFHGKAEGENAKMLDLRWREWAALLPLVALIVFLGVYPRPALDRIEPAVERLVEHVEMHGGSGGDAEVALSVGSEASGAEGFALEAEGAAVSTSSGISATTEAGT